MKKIEREKRKKTNEKSAATEEYKRQLHRVGQIVRPKVSKYCKYEVTETKLVRSHPGMDAYVNP